MTKRILAMVLAMAMVLCSMGTVVFAADEVTTIKTTDYTTFKEAMDFAYKTSGAVEVIISGAVEFTDGMELKGAFESITFIGADNDATITINQSDGGDYLEAHGEILAFENLKLAKANPGHKNNSGHMGNFFSLQGGTATYENCTFLNGACTSGGTATYNNCTFQNETYYGLWVYDNAIVTVDGGKVDSIRGIKVYAEDETNVTSTLTVKDATFTEKITEKGAVCIAYAKGVTLTGNTWNNVASDLELDSGSDANCEGVAFVAEDKDGNDITSTLTAIDRSNGNASCGVFVTDANGNKVIYTTATEAAKDAKEGDTVTLLYATEEDVTFGAGVVVDTNNYSAPNVGTVVASIERDGETNYYASLKDAIAAAAADTTATAANPAVVQLMPGTYELGTVKFPATVKNVTIKGAEAVSTFAANSTTTGTVLKDTILMASDGNNVHYDGITIDGITFDNSRIIFSGQRNGEVVYKNWTITNNVFKNIVNAPNNNAAVHLGNFNSANGEVMENFTFKNNTIDGVSGSLNSGLLISAADGTINVEGNTIKNVAFNTLQIINADNESTLNIKNNEFSNAAGSSMINIQKFAGTINLEKNTMQLSKSGQRFVGNNSTVMPLKSTGNKWLDENGKTVAEADMYTQLGAYLYNGYYYPSLEDVKAAAGSSDGKVQIIFDYAGGQDAKKNTIAVMYVNLRDSVTAPTGIKKDGFIFAGWDKKVQETAYAPETYTAQWVSLDDYKFKTVLTPVGGENVNGNTNEIKINPESSFIVEVSIEDAKTDMAWNVTEVTLSYNSKLFKWNDIDGTVTEKAGRNGINELTFKVYGADKVEGKVAKQLSFTTLPNSNTTSTFEGVFNVTKATVDTGWAANTINATLIDDENKGTAKVYIFYTFDVTVGDGVEAPSTADTITDYEGKIKDYDDDYNYDIIIDMEGNDDLDVDYDDATGEFVIPNEEIVGDFTIDAVVTGIKGISADDVEVHEYVEGKYALVLVNAPKKVNNKNRYYTYNGASMYVASHYDKYSGLKRTYAYLIKDGGFKAEQDPADAKKTTLNTDANKALALSKIKLGTANATIAGIDVIGDVNGTGKLDVNDIQAAWNAYNASSNDAPKVNENIDFYFRADVNRDKKVDMTDCNIVVEMYDGNETITKPVLATCDTPGNTLGITVGETVLVESVTIPADGHDYEWQGFTGKELNIKSTEVCTICGNTKVTPVTDVIENASIAYGNIKGTVNVESAEDLIYINRLSKAGTGNSGLLVGMEDELTINIKNDIDLAGYKWFPMYAARFVINGNHKTIKNLDAEQGYSGKSGFLSFGGGSTIKDLTLENVTAKGTQAGAFAGLIEGATIENCKIKGDINITWEQNTFKPNYNETWNGVAAVVGVVIAGKVNVADVGANLNIVTDGMTSDGDAAPDDLVKYVYNQTGNDYSNITITKN